MTKRNGYTHVKHPCQHNQVNARNQTLDSVLLTNIYGGSINGQSKGFLIVCSFATMLDYIIDSE